jgi:hypothetical protein
MLLPLNWTLIAGEGLGLTKQQGPSIRAPLSRLNVAWRRVAANLFLRPRYHPRCEGRFAKPKLGSASRWHCTVRLRDVVSTLGQKSNEFSVFGFRSSSDHLGTNFAVTSLTGTLARRETTHHVHLRLPP